jgi:hypothetical protein
MSRLLFLSSAFVGILIAGCTGESSQTPPGDVNQAQPDSAALANSPSDASDAIRQTYAQFAKALASFDVDMAANLVSERTFDMYSRWSALALDSSSVDFEKMSQIEVLGVFQLRYLLSRQELESMTGNDIFRWGVREGLVDNDAVKRIELDKIQIDGDEALATLISNQQPVPGIAYRFVNESSRWRLDLFHLMAAAEPVFDQVRRDAGKSKTELAVFLLEQTYNETIPIEILTGPLK